MISLVCFPCSFRLPFPLLFRLPVSLAINFVCSDLFSFKDFLFGENIRKFPGGALGYFLGGYVPPGTPNWQPVLEKISPKIDTPF